MHVRALKTFSGRMGLIRTGEVFTVDDRYGKQLMNNKLVVPHEPEQPKPETDKNLGDAPENKGGAGGEDDGGGNASGSDASSQSQNADAGKTDDTSAEQQGGGKAKAVSSPRAGRRSRKKT